MSIRVGQYDQFEDILELVNCRMPNHFSRLVKKVCVGVKGKGRGNKK